MQTDIALHRRQESSVKLLLLKSGFILPPVYQPDCSSDPWRWSPLLDVYVLVLLTGDRGKTKLKNITSQRGEGESLVLSWVRLDLNWVFIILCNFILFFCSTTFIMQLLLLVTVYKLHSANHVSPNLEILTLNFSDKWKDYSVVWKFEKSIFTVFCECCFYSSLPVNTNFISPVGKMNRWSRGPTWHIKHFHVGWVSLSFDPDLSLVVSVYTYWLPHTRSSPGWITCCCAVLRSLLCSTSVVAVITKHYQTITHSSLH